MEVPAVYHILRANEGQMVAQMRFMPTPSRYMYLDGWWLVDKR